MPTTTLPNGVEVMLEHGVRLHPNKASLQVRVRPFRPEAGYPLTEAGAREANTRRNLLVELYEQGITVAPARGTTSATGAKLRELAADHLAELEIVGGKRGRPYSPSGMLKAREACRPWTGDPIPEWKHRGIVRVAPPAVDGNGIPLADLPVAALTVEPLERYLHARYKLTPGAAIAEQHALGNILALAARRGHNVPAALFQLRTLRRRTVKRDGLPVDQARFWIDRVVEHQRNLCRLGLSLGCRISELLLAEDAWVDDEAEAITIPAWAAKERREKTLRLLPDEELGLIQRQRLARPAETEHGRGGTPLLFPRPGGTRWNRHGGFYDQIIIPAGRRAARDWRELHGLQEDADTPFEWRRRDEHGELVLDHGRPIVDRFQPHDLRRSCADLLRELEIPDHLAAARLGHKDSGYLMARNYASTRYDQLGDAIDLLADEGGIDARLGRRRAAAARARARRREVQTA